ncbi:hypothetical protein AAES_24578 [Amazona aestiva]|uniref:Uncharacterized protein n=1 Tax=Amazona aestiva TaxID=12930 RepID=A0A0Q3TTF5_AMAAE|nr:hypothetical protein AAES_24578 [Amazona aestiva]
MEDILYVMLEQKRDISPTDEGGIYTLRTQGKYLSLVGANRNFSFDFSKADNFEGNRSAVLTQQKDIRLQGNR